VPIAKADVLAVLDDPKLRHMCFSVGKLTVGAQEYRSVRDRIREGAITVIPGAGSVAFYDGRRKTIETQAGDPPLGLVDRAQILHECTHAVADIGRSDVGRLHGEVAAYLAQLTYIRLSTPASLAELVIPEGASAGPHGNLIMSMLQVVQKYSLHSRHGFGARISDVDVWRLTKDLQAYPPHALAKAGDAGVPKKSNARRASRAAGAWDQPRRAP
jgi:hypothetical protein